MGPTLIIVKSEHSKIFGGFTDIDWKSNDGINQETEIHLFFLYEMILTFLNLNA